MIAYRQRGLVNVYAIITNAVSVTVLLVFAAAVPSLKVLDLNRSVDLLPYCLAVFIGMAASNGLVRELGPSLHMLRLSDAFVLALRQTFYVAACVFTLMFVLKDRAISRIFLGSYLTLNLTVLTLFHSRVPRALARLLFSDRVRLPTLLLGRATAMENLDSWITNRGHLGIRVVGRLSDEKSTRAELAMAPRLGGLENLREVIRDKGVGQVILVEWMDDPVEVENVVQICESEGCRFLIHNNYGARFARSFTPLEEGGQHFLALQSEPLEDPLNRAAKRALDLAVALPVVVLLLPPLGLLVWVMQRLQSPGPLFFVRPRGGQNRREFPMYKFRSMRLAGHDPVGEAKQATAGDSRVFAFGRFMRRTSLDEIPQFINVLRGEMSVVGPRPHLPQHDDEFSRIARAYRSRALVKPGITGLAQVRGFRGEITDSEKLHRRVYWDLYYVTHWSLLLDVQLILRTVWLVPFPNEAAY